VIQQPDAPSLAPLCQAVFGWLGGSLDSTVVHLGPPMPGTAELLHDLVRANTAGLLTLGSQPAHAHQRSYVEALATRRLATPVADAARAAGLWVSIWPMSDPPPTVGLVLVTQATEPTISVVPAGTSDPDPRGYPSYDRPGFATEIRDDILAMHDGHRAVAASHHLTITDPVWGRRRNLWDTLCQTLPAHHFNPVRTTPREFP